MVMFDLIRKIANLEIARHPHRDWELIRARLCGAVGFTNAWSIFEHRQGHYPGRVFLYEVPIGHLSTSWHRRSAK